MTQVVCVKPGEETAVWDRVVTRGWEFLANDVDEQICPPIQSLERRYEASDKSWMKAWLEATDGDDDE